MRVLRLGTGITIPLLVGLKAGTHYTVNLLQLTADSCFSAGGYEIFYL